MQHRAAPQGTARRPATSMAADRPTGRPDKPATSPTNNGNVKVVVRARPLKSTEGSPLVSVKDGTTITIKPPTDGKPRSAEERAFTFDHSLWSVDDSYGPPVGQEDVYTVVGREFLDHNIEGFNTCVLAYGQTGSGKTHTMLGTTEDPGLIPRTCADLFERVDKMKHDDVSCTVQISYFEIYNEVVRDLLACSDASSGSTPNRPAVPRPSTPTGRPSTPTGRPSSRPGSPTKSPTKRNSVLATALTASAAGLRVRESPETGPYIEGLSEHTVTSTADVLRYLEAGGRARATAETKMNAQSSRSHAVFTVVLKQTRFLYDDGTATEERVSRIRLVDLAGSERADVSGTSGARLREGSNINKSLSTLGRVIEALVAGSFVVPYRDSVLTYLLKESLGGNSKTAMIACVAPANYDETLSTLRYADSAKRITTRAVANKDIRVDAEKDKLLASQSAEIQQLRAQLALRGDDDTPGAPAATNDEVRRALGYAKLLEDQLAQTRRLAGDMREQLVATRRHNGLLTSHLRDMTNSPWRDSAKSELDELTHEHESLMNDLATFRESLAKSRARYVCA